MNVNNLEKTVINFFKDYHTKKISILILNAERLIIKKYVKKGKTRILDLCCGYGRWSFPLAKEGHNVIGVDFCPELIKIAKSRNYFSNLKFYCKNILNMDLKNGDFDYILIMGNSLECIPLYKRRRKIIEKCYNALKPGGLLITSFNSPFYPPKLFLQIFIQNIRNFFRRTFYKNGAMEFNDIILNLEKPIFVHFFTFNEIKKLFSKFKIVEIVSMNELDTSRNHLPCFIYPLTRPLLYTFWVFKKC